MSPTSYQAAPPRIFTIAERHDSVKFLAILLSPARTQLTTATISQRLSENHQVLYAVPSLPTSSDPECTSSMPVLL